MGWWWRYQCRSDGHSVNFILVIHCSNYLIGYSSNIPWAIPFVVGVFSLMMVHFPVVLSCWVSLLMTSVLYTLWIDLSSPELDGGFWKGKLATWPRDLFQHGHWSLHLFGLPSTAPFLSLLSLSIYAFPLLGWQSVSHCYCVWAHQILDGRDTRLGVSPLAFPSPYPKYACICCFVCLSSFFAELVTQKEWGTHLGNDRLCSSSTYAPDGSALY